MSEQTDSVVSVSDVEKKKWSNNVWRYGAFKFFVDFQLWLPIWVFYLNETRGLSITEITFLDVPFWLLLIILEVPTGIVADRWGRKVSLCYGAFINAVAVLVFGLAGNIALLFISTKRDKRISMFVVFIGVVFLTRYFAPCSYGLIIWKLSVSVYRKVDVGQIKGISFI